MAIPLEVLTFGASAVTGGAMKLMSLKMQMNAEFQKGLLERANINIKSHDAAAARSKGFPWVKRFIAIVALLSIVTFPLVVPFILALMNIDQIPIVQGYIEVNPGFLWLDDKTVTIWKELNGIVITPLHTTLMSAIIGYFLGSDVVKR